MRSTSDLTTRRLSLRLRLSGRCSSKLEIPTDTGMVLFFTLSQRSGARLPHGRTRSRKGMPPVASGGAQGGGGLPAVFLQGRRHLFLEVGLDDVAWLEILEAVEPDAAVEAAPHLGGV